MLSLLLIALGVAILWVGGEILVDSVSHLAHAFAVSPLVISLTVVAFGTSAPELAASIVAAAAGRPELAVGNVVGSNIANIGLILGISAVAGSLVATASFIWRETAFMIGTSALLLPFVATGSLNRPQALVLFVLLGIFLWMMRGSELPDPDGEGSTAASKTTARLRGVLGSAIGLLYLTYGAKVLVDGAVDLAVGFGVSTEIIGLTLVAFGTSVPELASSIIATLRRQGEIILGNIVGSNVFNTLLILPVALLIRPLEVSLAGMGMSVIVMILFSLGLLAALLTGRRISRAEGIVLLAGYGLYLVYLGFHAKA